MWADAGLTRTTAGLEHAASVLATWERDERMPGRTAGPDSPSGTDTARIEDANLLLVATEVVDAALRRTASVGAHHRADETFRIQDETASQPVAALLDPLSVLHFEPEGAF
jgi:L-aspartate oxidase